MLHEGLVDCVGGVVARWDEDGILRVAVYEDDQELVAVIWRERSHNVNRQRVPRALRLDSASRFLAVAVVGAQLTLGTALSGLQADAVASLVHIPVTEEFPQRVATKVSGGMKLTGDPVGLVLIAQHTGLYYYYYYYYIPDCKPQLGELDAKNPKAPAGKTAQ